MIAALILVISLAALAQFGVFTWRMAVITLAAEPISETGQAAICPNVLETNNFQALAALNSLCPDLNSRGSRMHLVEAYFRAVHALGRMTRSVLPSVAAWSRGEMALCSRYAAVVIDQRLQRNLTSLAELRSY